MRIFLRQRHMDTAINGTPPPTPPDPVEELVGLLYRGILKRAPDQGLAGHCATLGLAPSLEAVIAQIREFIIGPENSHANWINAATLLPPLAAEPPVAHIVSIGSHCAASQFLKTFSLKRYSGPFDWIFSSLGMVADCLENDFVDFLNRDFYAPIPPHQRMGADLNFCNHTLYQERHGIISMFNHSDPLEPQAHANLVRCVQRFQRMLASSGRKVLFNLETRGDNQTAEHFRRLTSLLDQRYTGCELLIVKVENPGTDGTHGLTLLDRAGAHRLYSMVPTAPCGPVAFTSRYDDLVINRLLNAMPLNLAPAPD